MSKLPRPNPPPAEPLVGAETQLVWRDPFDPVSGKNAIKIALLWLVTLAAYLPVLSGGFLWQDDRVITANETIRSWPTLLNTWRHPRAMPIWRPVADTLLWPQHIVWHAWNPGGYHLISLAFHLVNTLLVWKLMRRLNLPGALVAAGLFALHPVGVHAVGWLAQQPVLVATMFSLSAVLVWLRWSEIDPPLPEIDGAWNLSHKKWLLAIVTVVLLLAALLSDAPTACFVPVAMYLIAWWKFADTKAIVPLAVLTIGVTAFVVWAEQSQSAEPAALASRAMIVPVAARGVLFHLGKLVLPYPLLLAYSRWNMAAWMWLFPLALVAAIGLIVWKRDRIGRGAVAGALGFAALVLPPVALHDARGGGDGFVTDSQQYLARAALLIAAAALLVPLVPEPDEEGRHRATRPLIGFALMLLLVGLTWLAGETCRSNRVAWEHALAHDPDSRIARAELGNLALATDQPQEAVEQFRQLVASDPSDGEAQLRLGEALMRQNRLDDAAAHFERAAALHPRDPEPQRMRGAAAERRGDLPTAKGFYEQAIAIDPRDDRSRNNLATLYARQGDTARALAEFQRALAENPNATQVHLNLASLLFSMGRLDEAAAHLHEAVNIDPGDPKAYITSGAILLQFKDYTNATRMFRAAIRYDRRSPEAFNLLGVALAAQGDLPEAIYNFGRALDLKPDYAPAKRNLEAARRQRDGIGAATTTSATATTRNSR
jgi:Flp pilus assembly protein TadD